MKNVLTNVNLDKYLPSEDSKLAAFIRWVVLLWKVGKVFFILGGVFLIFSAGQIVGATYTAIPSILIKGLNQGMTYCMPLFLDLIVASFKYLWQPILAYVLIGVCTKSQIGRKFWCLVGVAWFLLHFVQAVEGLSWENYQLILLLSLQGYLFVLWFLPREIWNVAGLIVSATLGLIILILPDLPTAFDDFGLFGAILAFFLGYLNALASLLQRAVNWL